MTRLATLVRRLLAAAALLAKVRKRLFERSRGKAQVVARRSQFYRRIWEEAAAAAGASISALDPRRCEIHLADGRVIRVNENITSLDDPVTVALAEDKPLVYELLEREGVPAPRHTLCAADDLWTAWRFVRGLGGPCVVKPARGSAGGTGITTGVCSLVSLARALVSAGAYCSDAVIEQEVAGDVYRLLYLDGELIDAVLRRAPTLRGDGRATVRQLIETENARRQQVGIAAAQSLITIDQDVRRTLRGAGLTLRAVPPAGSVVRVKTVISDNRREDNEPAADLLSPAIVAAGARAAAAVGARLAGVDVITPDAGAALEACGGAVIEVNATPGYYFHYMTSGAGTPVATLILERLAAAPA